MASLQVIREQLESAEGKTPGVLDNVIDDLVAHEGVVDAQKMRLRTLKETVLRAPQPDSASLAGLHSFLTSIVDSLQNPPDVAPLARAREEAARAVRERAEARIAQLRGQGRRSQTKKFGSCVKAVRKTVKARKGSNAESAAIAICTTTLLHPRGRTIKRYTKKRLLTQKRRKV
jgi:hypothetical protein